MSREYTHLKIYEKEILELKRQVKLEALENIRKEIRTTRKSRKNNKRTKKLKRNNNAISSWSFYRLQQFIKYKAELLNIEVVEVNPAFTSQMCPNCGKHNVSDGRNYSCECGYKGHRDVVGAINISKAEPATDDKDKSKKKTKKKVA